MKTINLLSIGLSLIVQSASAQVCYRPSGEYALDERQNGQLIRRTQEAVSGNIMVRVGTVLYPFDTGGYQILTTTFTCHRYEARKNSWQVKGVVEAFFNPSNKIGRIFSVWPPERVNTLPILTDNCNVVGRNKYRINGTEFRRTGYHAWAIEDVPTHPWKMPVIFPCKSLPEVGLKWCSLSWRLDTAGGVFTPDTESIPTKTYCPDIGLLVINHPTP